MHVRICATVPTTANELSPGTLFEIEWDDETVVYLKTRSRDFQGSAYVRLNTFQHADPALVGHMTARVIGRLIAD